MQFLNKKLYEEQKNKRSVQARHRFVIKADKNNKE